ncbi:hypothetical protein G4W71_17650 [Clostridium botulinum]|uniref:hypothetical protein n=1 Tax=Clostridium botulinum TaxID=1491 RepID=UPI001788D720|nr:hypothetical protein [Clostridium botulinum]MBE1305831.1 hypothetical protein [Clostridium botulinum]
MSEETKHLKLFKYDKETDDFNTTTFNIKKCLNDNWDKIDLDHEDTTKEITDLKSTDELHNLQINQLNYVTAPPLIKREVKDSDTGVFTTVTLRDSKTKNRIVFSNLHSKSGDVFTKQTVNIYNDKDQQVTQYRFELIYDSDGELIERKLL